jgi:hypothetical protein
MARAEDSAFSPGLALPVGSLVVPTTSADFGTCCSKAGWGCYYFSEANWGYSGFSGASWCCPSGYGASCGCSVSSGPLHLLPAPKISVCRPEQMLKELATQGLPSLL